MAGVFSRTQVISSILVSCFLLASLAQVAEAREYLIGGKTNAWKASSSEADSLNHWSQKSRFLIGDSLVFQYDRTKDLVLVVSKVDYDACNTSSPIKSYRDGNTTVNLDRSGPFYFISGADGHCASGQRVVVVVISERHRSFVGVSPAASPDSFVPAPAPTSGTGSVEGGFMVGLMAGMLALAAM